MDHPHSAAGPPYSSVRTNHLFASHQLPPPPVQLPAINLTQRASGTTLPPMAAMDSSSPYHHPSPVSWGSSSSSIHRTSNSREDVTIHSHLQRSEVRPMKRESNPHQIHNVSPPQPPPPVKEQDDSIPSTSDFVKKLYKMLEDHTFSHVVSWGPQGDCFVVKDMNEFTKSILPRMFKHSNFASFVRQLNKYDFHKVKTTDEAQFGEHSWTFRHPDFHAERRDALENIKRKVPAARKSLPSSSTTTGGRGTSSGSPIPGSDTTELVVTMQAHVNALQNSYQSLFNSHDTLLNSHDDLRAQTDTLLASHASLRAQNESLFASNESLRNQVGRAEERVRVLERQYGDVLVEMVNFQKGIAQQDGLMQGLIQYFLGEGGRHKDASCTASQKGVGPSAIITSTAQSLISQSTTAQPLPPASAIHGLAQTQPGMAQMSTTPLAPSMTPSTHPPPSLLASLAQQRFVGQPQPSPFLAPSNFPSHTRKSTSMSQPPLSSSLQNPYTMPPPHPHHLIPPQEQFVPAQELGLQDPDIVARESLVQMNEMSRRATSGMGFMMAPSTSATSSSVSGSSSSPDEQSDLHLQGMDGVRLHSHRATQQQQQQQAPAHTSMQCDDAPFLLPPDMTWDTPMTHEGLQVFTVGHLLPRSSVEDQNGNWTFDANSSAAGVGPPPTEGGVDDEGGRGNDNDNLSAPPEPEPDSEEVVRPTPSNGRSSTTPTTIRVRRSTFVPGWAVPPRVLLVDDDAVSRRLSSKFLQVFGCMIDVAVDGVGAVTKMNLEKYDLVLMDIVMPKMDGISATNLIRQFDHMTPIISMTSNSKPSEIMTYYSSGMNDILPKPFTKEGLLDMLEKHLMHLKVIQQMSKVPRSIGVPPLSDASFSEALAVGASQLQLHSSTASSTSNQAASSSSLSPRSGISGYDDDGRINPLAGMGLSDERYEAILRDIVTQESFSGVGVPEGYSFLAGALGPGMQRDIGGLSGEKRGLDDQGDGREGKRARFEIIE